MSVQQHESPSSPQPSTLTPLTPNLAGIPAKLKAISHWLVWKSEEREGKSTKVPYSPRTGKKARVNDPKTWSTFDEAVEAHRKGGYAGLGFVFWRVDPAGNDGQQDAGNVPPLVGIDLDKCLNREAGEIDPEAQTIVKQMDSYTEISPSGTGLHIWAVGRLPPDGNREGPIEMYDHGRFFCITGHHLPGTPPTIEERTEQLAVLHAEVFGSRHARFKSNGARPSGNLAAALTLDDEELLEKARGAKDGDKFSRLWSGDWSEYPSQSEADQALCEILAFWCGPDSGRIDRLFRRSGLYREKWDKKRGSQTYGKRTITKAIERVSARGFYGERYGHTPGNGTEPPPEPVWNESEASTGGGSEEEENAHIIAQEREPEPEASANCYPCPDIIWQGIFAKVAERVGIRSWEVWIGTYAALSAVAHRNLHFRYFSDLYGMAYVLLVSPTGSGKSLATDLCHDLLPREHTVRYGAQSGPGLVPLLTPDSLNSKTGRIVVKGVPCLLIAEEWSRLAQVGGIQNSTLLEDLNALFQRRQPWSVSRSTKGRGGGDVVIENPSLSICGTTTNTLLQQSISTRQLSGGFLNRYLILPGRGEWREYTGESPNTVACSGILDHLTSHTWGVGREVATAYSPLAWEQFLDLQQRFFLPLMNTPDTSEVFRRLHFYLHHVACLYAWSERAAVIDMRHLQAAVQVINTSHQFLLSLLETLHTAVEVPRFQQYESGIEQRIIQRVEREPWVSRRKVIRSLYNPTPTKVIGQCIDNLISAGILEKKDGDRGQVLLHIAREKP
jgi:putative DNA primase/helicase